MKRTLLITFFITGLLAVVLLCVRGPAGWPAAETPPQQGEAGASALVDGRVVLSEQALARVVREPQNTWSNVAFVFGGAFLLTTAGSRLGRATGGVLIAVGVGSFLYHASGARELRHLDVGAMYWLFLTAVALCGAAAWAPARPAIERHAVALVVVALLLAVALTAGRNFVVAGMKPFSLKIATTITAVAVILSLAWIAHRVATMSIALQFLAIVTLFCVAAYCQTEDRPGGKLFLPQAAIQAHAVWHVLAAGAFVLAVRILDGVVVSTGAGTGQVGQPRSETSDV